MQESVLHTYTCEHHVAGLSRPAAPLVPVLDADLAADGAQLQRRVLDPEHGAPRRLEVPRPVHLQTTNK